MPGFILDHFFSCSKSQTQENKNKTEYAIRYDNALIILHCGFPTATPVASYPLSGSLILFNFGDFNSNTQASHVLIKFLSSMIFLFSLLQSLSLCLSYMFHYYNLFLALILSIYSMNSNNFQITDLSTQRNHHCNDSTNTFLWPLLF